METQQIWDSFNEELYFFILKKVKDKDVTNDIFQDTFLKIHNNLSYLKEEEKARAWVFQIARKEMFNYFNNASIYADKLDANIETPSQKYEHICCFDKFIDDLASFLVTCKNFYDPSVLIIGGGVINSSDLWWDDVLEKYKEKINSFDDMPIVKARYLNSAGIIGAASLILNEYE